MKTIVLFFIAFLVVASCRVSFMEKLKAAIVGPSSERKEIQGFFKGFFGHYNLSEPKQIYNCINDLNAKLMLAKLYDINDLLQDVNADRVVKVHQDWLKIILHDSALQSTHACIAITQDFTDLLDAFNVTERNPELFGIVNYLYYQAHFPQLLQDYTPVVANLNNKDFKAAGDAFGSVIDNLADTVKDEGLAHLAFDGFKNGQALHFNLNLPNDSLACFDRNSSEAYLHFWYELSDAVTNGSVIDAPLNTHIFWEKRGKDLLTSIPDSAWECLENSKDNQDLTNKLGVDIGSQEFLDRASKYIKDHRVGYYSHLKTLKHTMKHLNLIHAGSVYADLLSSIVGK